jgi:hypothetical protein
MMAAMSTLATSSGWAAALPLRTVRTGNYRVA